MSHPIDAGQRPDLGAVFTAAKQEFDRWAPLLWNPMGQALTDFVGPVPGDRVLDACCGAGSSALPAAQAVGPRGSAVAVDLASGLLDSGRARAAEEGLGNVRFEQADVTRWHGGPFDVVQCAYGVFMLPDMDTGAAHLMSLLRPGGRFGVSVWLRGSLEDFGRALYDVASRHQPAPDASPPGAGAIGRVDEPDLLRTWLARLGLDSVEVRTVPGSVQLDVNRAWSLVLGTGFRRVLHGLSASTVADVRAEFLSRLDACGITSATTTSLLGVGVKR